MERSVLKLFTFGPAWDMPDASPFCIKLETYLRMTGTPFEKAQGSPQQAPKGKLPYVDLGGGELLGDSARIIERLERQGGPALNGHLTPRARAHELAVRTMLEESTYHALAYFRWVDDANWSEYKHQIAAAVQRSGAPRFVARGLMPIIRRDVRKVLHAQGMGRHTPEEIAAVGNAHLDVLAELLADDPYLFGDRPTVADTIAFALLVNLLDCPLPTPMKAHAQANPIFGEYVDRIKAEHWRD